MSKLQNRVEKLEDHLTPSGTPFFLLVYPDGTCQAQGVRYRSEEEARAVNPDINGTLCITLVTPVTRDPGEGIEYHGEGAQEAAKLAG
jgi:hypothetical protein